MSVIKSNHNEHLCKRHKKQNQNSINNLKDIKPIANQQNFENVQRENQILKKQISNIKLNNQQLKSIKQKYDTVLIHLQHLQKQNSELNQKLQKINKNKDSQISHNQKNQAKKDQDKLIKENQMLKKKINEYEFKYSKLEDQLKKLKAIKSFKSKPLDQKMIQKQNQKGREQKDNFQEAPQLQTRKLIQENRRLVQLNRIFLKQRQENQYKFEPILRENSQQIKGLLNSKNILLNQNSLLKNQREIIEKKYFNLQNNYRQLESRFNQFKKQTSLKHQQPKKQFNQIKVKQFQSKFKQIQQQFLSEKQKAVNLQNFITHLQNANRHLSTQNQKIYNLYKQYTKSLQAQFDQ